MPSRKMIRAHLTQQEPQVRTLATLLVEKVNLASSTLWVAVVANPSKSNKNLIYQLLIRLPQETPIQQLPQADSILEEVHPPQIRLPQKEMMDGVTLILEEAQAINRATLPLVQIHLALAQQAITTLLPHNSPIKSQAKPPLATSL